MKEEENIDRIFKEKLSQREFQLKDEHLAKMEMRLDQYAKKSKRKKWGFTLFFVVGLSLLYLPYHFYMGVERTGEPEAEIGLLEKTDAQNKLVLKKRNPLDLKKKNGSLIKSDITTNTNNSEKEIIKIRKEGGKEMGSSKVGAHTNRKPDSITKQEEIFYEEQEDKKDVESEETVEEKGIIREIKRKSEEVQKSLESKDMVSIGGQSREKNVKKGIVSNSSVDMKKSENNHQEKNEGLVVESIGDDMREMVGLDTMRKEVTLNSTDLTVIADSTDIDDEKKDEKQRTLSMGLVYSPEYTFKSRSEDVAFNRFPKYGYTGGVSFVYQLSNKWALETGLQYSTKGERLEYETINTISKAPSNTEFISVDLISSTDTTGITFTTSPIPVVLTPQEIDTAITRFNVNFSYNYLEVPFRVNYFFSDKKLKTYSAFGVSVGVFLNQRIHTTIDYDNGDRQEIHEKGNQENVNPLNFAISVGLGIEYRISEKIKLRLESNYKRFLLPTVDHAPVQEYLNAFGGAFGFYYDLSK